MRHSAGAANPCRPREMQRGPRNTRGSRGGAKKGERMVRAAPRSSCRGRRTRRPSTPLQRTFYRGAAFYATHQRATYSRGRGPALRSQAQTGHKVRRRTRAPDANPIGHILALVTVGTPSRVEAKGPDGAPQVYAGDAGGSGDVGNKPRWRAWNTRFMTKVMRTPRGPGHDTCVFIRAVCC
jgi:hypothetical protein